VDVYASGHHHAFFAGTDEAGMLHLGLGALGGNARAFSGGRTRQPFSFALLNVAEDEVSVVARIAPDFADNLPTEQLPATVSGPLGSLRRLDGPARLRP